MHGYTYSRINSVANCRPCSQKQVYHFQPELCLGINLVYYYYALESYTSLRP